MNSVSHSVYTVYLKISGWDNVHKVPQHLMKFY